MKLSPRLRTFGSKYARTSAVSFVLGIALFSGSHLFAQTAVYPGGHLHQVAGSGNAGTNPADWSCDSGYTLMSYNWSTGSSNNNNTNWYGCVASSHVPPTGTIQGVGYANGVAVSYTTSNAQSAYVTVNGGYGQYVSVPSGTVYVVTGGNTGTMQIVLTNGTGQTSTYSGSWSNISYSCPGPFGCFPQVNSGNVP
jgi:hypothetical protein